MSQIRVNEIPDGGLHLEVSASEQGWVRAVMQTALHEHFLPDDEAQVQLDITRTGDNISLCGGIYVHMHATCDRCLREFPSGQQIPLHMLLAPAAGVAPGGDLTAWNDDAAAANDDYQFGLYHGGVVELDRILTEHVVLAQPMQSLCTVHCLGLCPSCGADLNEGPCRCATQGKSNLA